MEIGGVILIRAFDWSFRILKVIVQDNIPNVQLYQALPRCSAKATYLNPESDAKNQILDHVLWPWNRPWVMQIHLLLPRSSVKRFLLSRTPAILRTLSLALVINGNGQRDRGYVLTGIGLVLLGVPILSQSKGVHFQLYGVFTKQRTSFVLL